MARLLSLVLLLSAPAAAEPLSDKIDREYVQPALSQVQGALAGREPNWTPPVLPGTAQTARLSEQVRARWLEPLMGAGHNYALDAARTLASPQAFEAPAEPDLAAILPDASISPATEELVTAVERRFLSRLFPEDYALKAAGALGAGADEEGPAAPDQDDLTRLPSDAGAAAPGGPAPGSVRAESPRFARANDFTRKRRVADSTRLAHGSAGAAAPSKLKPTRSRFTAVP